MPLYCKVSIKAYSEGEGGSDKAAPGHLADLQHEGQRLAEKQDQSLLFETPANVGAGGGRDFHWGDSRVGLFPTSKRAQRPLGCA